MLPSLYRNVRALNGTDTTSASKVLDVVTPQVYGGEESDEDRRDLPITAKDFKKIENLKKVLVKK